jgi:hypothetical protein
MKLAVALKSIKMQTQKHKYANKAETYVCNNNSFLIRFCALLVELEPSHYKKKVHEVSKFFRFIIEVKIYFQIS